MAESVVVWQRAEIPTQLFSRAAARVSNGFVVILGIRFQSRDVNPVGVVVIDRRAYRVRKLIEIAARGAVANAEFSGALGSGPYPDFSRAEAAQNRAVRDLGGR